MAKIALKLRFLLTLFAGVSMGLCIGAALMNALISYRIDSYYKEIQYLNTVIENKDVRLEKLESSINKNKLIVSDIKIYLEYQPKITNDKNEMNESQDKNELQDMNELHDMDSQTDTNRMDEFDKIILETAIRDKYKKLIGREVKDIDTSILGDIIDNRIMKTEHAEYKLYVSKMILSDNLEIWLIVEKLN